MVEAQNQDRVIRADKRVRILVVVAWVVCLCIAVVLIRWVLPWGRAQLERSDPGRALHIIQFVVGFIFLSIVPFGVYLFHLGQRVVKHRQMPPPGTRVIVDTKVLEGDKAVTRGRLIIVISLLLISMGLLGGLYLPYKLRQVFSEQIRQAPPQANQVR